MIMTDLGRGVRVCVADRSYFKVRIPSNNNHTVRVEKGKIPFNEEMTSAQREVIKANMGEAPSVKTAAERALEEIRTGEIPSLYKNLVNKDIVQFADEYIDGDELIQITASQLTELRESAGGGSDDEILAELASMREQLDEYKNQIEERDGIIGRLEAKNDKPAVVSTDVGGNETGGDGETSVASNGTIPAKWTSGPGNKKGSGKKKPGTSRK